MSSGESRFCPKSLQPCKLDRTAPDIPYLDTYKNDHTQSAFVNHPLLAGKPYFCQEIMTTCSAFSSLLNVSDSKITNPDVGFSKIKFLLGKKTFPRFRPKKSAPIADNYPSSSGSCNSATIANSVTLDFGSVNDEEVKKAESKLGSKVRVTVPLTVYHVPKLPELDLTGMVGVLKQYVGFHKGKRISANLPFKVEFETDQVLGRDGKPVKFTAHLRDDEFEILV